MVIPENKLIFKMLDGTKREYTWVYESRSESWIDEMRKNASIRELRRLRDGDRK